MSAPKLPTDKEQQMSLQTKETPSDLDSPPELPPSRRDSMEPSRRDSMEPSRRDSMEPSRRDSMEPSRHDSMEPSRRDSMETYRPKHQTESYSLDQFAKKFSKDFPLHIRVTKGHYAPTYRETVSKKQVFVALYEKKQEVLRVRSKRGNIYSIPYGSSIPISLLYCPDGNETKALTGAPFFTLPDLKQLPQDRWPKVISCNSSDEELAISSNDVLVVKRLDPKSQRLLVHSIPRPGEPSETVNSKELSLDLSCKTSIFSTKPDSIALYLSDIVKFVPAPEQGPAKALLHLDKLPSSECKKVKRTDPTLLEPVTLVDFPCERSLVVSPAKSCGEYDSSQLLEIPIKEELPIEVTTFKPQALTSYSSRFDPKKLKIWAVESGEENQIQQIFSSSLRPGHEMAGINCPEYEKISSPVPVRPSPLPSPTSTEPTENTKEPGDTVAPASSDPLQPSSPSNVSREASGYDSMITELVNRPTKETPPTETILEHSNLPLVVTELADCKECWYLLAILLGVPKTRAAQILAFSINNPRRGLIEAVSFWLDNSPNASWSAIVKALYVLERRNKARELAEKYDLLDIPGCTGSTSHTTLSPKDFQDVFTQDDIEEIKKLGKSIDQISERLQDLIMKIIEHQHKKENLRQRLADLRERLEFNEEYTHILMCESQMATLEQKTGKKLEEGKDQTTAAAHTSYKRRKQFAEEKRITLDQELLSIEGDCRKICSEINTWQEERQCLEKEKREFEEKLNERVTKKTKGEPEGATPSLQELDLDYISMIIESGQKEQNKYGKEMEQLHRDLESKETELKALESTLETIQKSLLEIECKLFGSLRSLAKSGADSLLDESRRTCLKVDKVDFELQIYTVEFVRDDLRSRLKVKEEQLEKSKRAQTAFESPFKRSSSEPQSTLKKHKTATKPHRPRSVSVQSKVRQTGGIVQTQKSTQGSRKTSQP